MVGSKLSSEFVSLDEVNQSVFVLCFQCLIFENKEMSLWMKIKMS